MDINTQDIKGFECSETDNNYLITLISFLKSDLSKTDLGIEVSNLIKKHKRKPVNGLISNLVTDIECHLGIYNNKYSDFEHRKDFDYSTGLEFYIKILETIRTCSDFKLPDNVYKTYSRWFYYKEEKIEIEVLYKENWNYILYKSKSNLDFYLRIVFNQSFTSWDVDFKVEGEQHQMLLLAIQDNKINIELLTKVVEFYKSEHYKNRNK